MGDRAYCGSNPGKREIGLVRPDVQMYPVLQRVSSLRGWIERINTVNRYDSKPGIPRCYSTQTDGNNFRSTEASLGKRPVVSARIGGRFHRKERAEATSCE
jgi:hypothetical protein